MLKLLYAGLVAVFAGTMIFVGARAGLFSPANRSGLTADFKLASEIPIDRNVNRVGNGSKSAAAKQKASEAGPAVKAPAKVVAMKVPEPVPAPAPVFAPVPPTKVVLPVPAPVPAPEPTPVVLPTPEPAPVPTPTPTPTPAPVEEPVPAPTPVPDPVPDPTPDPTPIPAPEPTPEPEPTPGPITIFISEILFNAVGSDVGKEFVELYNPTSSEVNLDNWTLKISTTGAMTSLAVVGSKPVDVTKIPAHGFLLIGLSGYNASPAGDVVRSASLPNGQATLYLNTDSDLVMDQVGYDGTAMQEGQSLERQNYNGAFQVESNPSPQNSQSPTI